MPSADMDSQYNILDWKQTTAMGFYWTVAQTNAKRLPIDRESIKPGVIIKVYNPTFVRQEVTSNQHPNVTRSIDEKAYIIFSSGVTSCNNHPNR